MERLDKRAPFTATGGIIPPEFEHIKTPCYILDEKALIENAKLLGGVAERTGCKMLLAQKAFSNYDCYPFFEPYLAGTEASGLYEARLGAEEMPGKEVHVFCAGYRADEFEELLQYADHIVFNSPSQLLRFGRMAKEAGKSVGLRINPECSTQEGHEIYDPCAPGSRMGTTRVQWDEAIVKNPELMELLDGVHKVVRDEDGLATDFEIEGDFPKYGNDDDRADDIAVWLLKTFLEKLKKRHTYRDSEATTSILTITSNVVYGKATGNMPDGRRAGEPLSPGANPSYGAEQSGLLASLNSVAKLPYEWALDGISNTQTINPDALGHSEQERIDNLVQVMDGYFDQGAHHLNVNVFGTEKLIDAMEHPEKEEYANFTIRVSGYAVKFIDLTREQQMDVISRTCHATM